MNHQQEILSPLISDSGDDSLMLKKVLLDLVVVGDGSPFNVWIVRCVAVL